MIPNRAQCLLLFDRYELPSQKKIHVEAVTELALFFAKYAKEKEITVDEKLLQASSLLHDIDKMIPKKEGERHPDTAVRVLTELGFPEVAGVVAKHSLHHILRPETAPTSWEEKLLYLSDKMTKYEVIGVDHRFKLWYKENLSPDAVAELNAAYPKVKVLEKEVYERLGISFADLEKELQYS